MSRITDRPRSLNGLTIAVTGSTSGIGYFIAEGFARLGADLIVTARSENKARAVLAMLPGPGTHTAVSLDLADISSIRAAGATLGAGNRLDALVMNAGVINASPTYTHGPFGVESQRSWPTRLAARLLAPLVATVVQGKDDAALPAIAAITAQKLPRGTYVGPQYTAAGMPFFDEPVPSSRDPELGTNLWTQTERTLGHGILAALGTTP